jgi:hypothetical protein
MPFGSATAESEKPIGGSSRPLIHKEVVTRSQPQKSAMRQLATCTFDAAHRMVRLFLVPVREWLRNAIAWCDRRYTQPPIGSELLSRWDGRRAVTRLLASVGYRAGRCWPEPVLRRGSLAYAV